MGAREADLSLGVGLEVALPRLRPRLGCEARHVHTKQVPYARERRAANFTGSKCRAHCMRTTLIQGEIDHCHYHDFPLHKLRLDLWPGVFPPLDPIPCLNRARSSGPSMRCSQSDPRQNTRLRLDLWKTTPGLPMACYLFLVRSHVNAQHFLLFANRSARAVNSRNAFSAETFRRREGTELWIRCFTSWSFQTHGLVVLLSRSSEDQFLDAKLSQRNKLAKSRDSLHDPDDAQSAVETINPIRCHHRFNMVPCLESIQLIR
jgi:hypothetical protein